MEGLLTIESTDEAGDKLGRVIGVGLSGRCQWKSIQVLS